MDSCAQKEKKSSIILHLAILLISDSFTMAGGRDSKECDWRSQDVEWSYMFTHTTLKTNKESNSISS